MPEIEITSWKEWIAKKHNTSPVSNLGIEPISAKRGYNIKPQEFPDITYPPELDARTMTPEKADKLWSSLDDLGQAVYYATHGMPIAAKEIYENQLTDYGRAQFDKFVK